MRLRNGGANERSLGRAVVFRLPLSDGRGVYSSIKQLTPPSSFSSKCRRRRRRRRRRKRSSTGSGRSRSSGCRFVREWFGVERSCVRSGKENTKNPGLFVRMWDAWGIGFAVYLYMRTVVTYTCRSWRGRRSACWRPPAASSCTQRYEERKEEALDRCMSMCLCLILHSGGQRR